MNRRTSRITTIMFMSLISTFILCMAVFADSVPERHMDYLPNIQISDDVNLSSQHPSCALSPEGYLYVVYAERTVEMNPDMLLFNRSADNGQTWLPISVTVHRNSPGIACTTPDVAVNANGDILVVWRECTTEYRSEVWFAKSMDGGESWTEGIRIHEENLEHDYVLPSILVWDNHTFVAMTRGEGNAGIAHFIYSEDFGDNWSDPILVSNEECTLHEMPSFMALNDVTGRLAMTINSNDHCVLVSVSDDLGHTWSSPVPVSKTEFPVIFHSHIHVHEGQFYLVWCARKNMETKPDLYFNTSEDGVEFSDEVIISDESHTQYSPRIHVAKNGTIHVYWHWQPGDPMANRFNCFYSASQDHGLTWSEPVQVNNTGECAAHAQYAWGGDMICDSENNACFFWTDFRNYPVDFYFDIYFATTRPMVTPSPTPTPTPSPTATPIFSGVILTMPSHIYRPGYPCWLRATLYLDPHPGEDLPFFLILEANGNYFYYPSWTDAPDYQYRTIPVNGENLEVFTFFDWPDNAGSGEATFYGAFTDSSMTTLTGEMGIWDIQWTM
ncbi:glycoside hydrolase [bacterium]|nr:glycoside hydrolase [bacterium]